MFGQQRIKADGCRHHGRGIEVAQEAMGFLQMPPDDLRGAVHTRPVDGACCAVIQKMEEGGQPCDVLGSFRGYVADRCIAAAAGEFAFNGIVGLYPGGVGRWLQIQH